jgi:hypothetical protein
LSAFIESLHGHATAIETAARPFGETIFCMEEPYALALSQETSFRTLEELELQIKTFHDSIEFSSYLPLAVVPFLLPLLAVLKKASLLIHSSKRLLIDIDTQAETYEYYLAETHLLKEACQNIVLQSRYIAHQSRFREKSIRDCAELAQ